MPQGRDIIDFKLELEALERENSKKLKLLKNRNA